MPQPWCLAWLAAMGLLVVLAVVAAIGRSRPALAGPLGDGPTGDPARPPTTEGGLPATIRRLDHKVRALSFRLIAASAVLLLVWPSALAESAAPATQTFPHQFEITGPVPIFHSVRLWVDTIQIHESGDQWSPGDVRFRFRLDVGPCPSLEDEIAQEDSFYREFGPGTDINIHDCDYTHVVTRGPENVFDGQVLDVNTWLPPPTEDDIRPREVIARYSGDLIRARMGGTELDVITDEPMGGAVMVWRCGFPGFVDGCGPQSIDFNTCEVDYPSGNIEQWPCYSLTGGIQIEPEPPEPERNLIVSGVRGTAGVCIGGQDFTFGVDLHNPEAATSDVYGVRIGLLDPVTRTIVESWESALQPRLSPLQATETAVPVTVQLPAGNNQLMVAAIASGPRISMRRRETLMATSVELAVRCYPESVFEPIFRQPTPSPAVGPPLPQRDTQAPTSTPTQRVEIPDREVHVATPTSTPERPDPLNRRTTPTPDGAPDLDVVHPR